MVLSNTITMQIFSQLEQQWLSTLTTTTDIKKTKILTIDGGGTSAFIAGAFLVHLEQTLQAKTSDTSARIVDFFDVIAGTGVGALLAVLLSAADSAGRPMFSAVESVQFLINNREKLFMPKKSGVLHRFSRRRCSAVSLARLLRETFGNKTLKDTCKPILVPCYDTVSSAPFVFSGAAASSLATCAALSGSSTRDDISSPAANVISRADMSESSPNTISRAAASASGKTSLDFELWKVCCAAMATPSIFEPFEVVSVDGKTVLTAIDGGLVMNNPAAVAVTHVLHNKVDFTEVNGVEDLMLLSLGNGTLKCRGSSEKWSGGSKKMSDSVVDVAIDGVSETVDQMLGNAFSWNRNDYVRIQANGLGGSGLMTKEEVLKERGIESVAFGGKRLLAETNGDRLEGFVQRLVNASAKTSLPPSPHKPFIPLLDGR